MRQRRSERKQNGRERERDRTVGRERDRTVGRERQRERERERGVQDKFKTISFLLKKYNSI